ncbi:hypothetical protein JCM33374_g4688 [Metschnikowia sp. JCM 33374]|nr:hypothetical protein JCM33374_g4688 [Metschnikowia sp. JCM 33374]
MSTSSPSINQSSLARFAFNIYGSLNDRASHRVPEKPKSASSKKLKYVCDREITCVSQLHHPLARLGSTFYEAGSSAPYHHVLIGGKNYLKLLALNVDQTSILADINLIDTHAPHSSRIHASSKLFNVNTIKTQGDLVACGLTSGSVNVYQISNNGKAKLAHRLDDHKRVVNSLDFVDNDQALFSGSQDGTVRLWDLRSFGNKPALKLKASQHSDPVRSCQYSPHSKVRGKMTVLSVHDSGALCKFDLRYPSSSNSGLSLPERKWTFHTGPALSLHIHPELEYVLTGGRDRKICLWNYADVASNSMIPETTLNTYGPVMKIRWNDMPSDEPMPSSAMEINDDLHTQRLALNKYDFACSYLNDDPSITVFNLARKYVPREIVNTLTKKPFQNFIWAKTAPGDRKLWTITKSNVFVSYDLNSPDETAQNITRPLETLPAVTTSWSNGFSNLSVVSQDTHDFDMSLPINADTGTELQERVISEEGRIDDEGYLDHQSSPGSFDTSILPNRALQNSHPSTPTYFYSKNSTMSPKERPSLLRSSTQHSQPIISSSLGLQRSNQTDYGLSQPALRPSLNRNPSQTTVDSASSGNDAVFAALANDYLTGIPDAFTLSFVCQINARVAAGVQRFRDCQTWRMISVALEHQEPGPVGFARSPMDNDIQQNENPENPMDLLSKSPEEAKSISSDLGNVVGSYNSNSTSTTNYGSAPRKPSNPSSMNNLSILGSSRESTRGEHLLSNVKGFPKSNSTDFTKEATSTLATGTVSRSNSMGRRAFSSSPRALPDIDGINLHDGRGESDHKESSTSIEKNNQHIDLQQAVSGMAMSPPNPHVHQNDNLVEERSKFDTFVSKGRPIYGRGTPSNVSGTSHDLDDENLHLLTNASASLTSSAFSASVERGLGGHPQAFSPGSRDSPAGSWKSLGGKNLFNTSFNSATPHEGNNLLGRVEESNIQSKENQTSQLTKAISGYVKEDDIFRPWHAVNIIKKSLEYSLSQGDLVMSATLILLFYEYFQKNCLEELLEPESCLEVLGLYIETLRSKELYTIAVQVVKDSPAALKERLCDYAVKEVEMRFYCCWCKTLLTNEMSKAKYGVDNDKFGFWYCDECSRKQSNCIYCNEPCKGLTVVESLRCGHRGHFGCFQEWHIEDGNIECPGGCE